MYLSLKVINSPVPCCHVLQAAGMASDLHLACRQELCRQERM